jgi:hypothetical protein
MPMTSDLPKLPGHESLSKLHPPVSLEEIVFSKKFPDKGYHLSLRRFCISTDMQAIYHWAWKKDSAANLLASSYTYTNESSFARSFMVFMNESTPVCQVDICRSQQDDICDHYKAVPGDFVIRMLIHLQKKKPKQFYVDVLKTCLEYFFLSPEVERVIIEPDVENERYNDLVINTGFHFQQRIYQPYKISNLYYYTRDIPV